MSLALDDLPRDPDRLLQHLQHMTEVVTRQDASLVSLQADPFASDVFIFRSRRADRVKILVYDGTGLCLYSKRLEAGRFCWPSPAEGVVRLSAAPLATLLEGLPWHRLQPRMIPRPSTAW